MDRRDLEKVKEWANAKLATGDEPPWAWYQYMKLREALDAIIGGMEAVTPPTESSRESDLPQGTHLRLVEPTVGRDTSQCRPDQPFSPQMPM